MTERPEDVAQAGTAQAQGETAAATHQAAVEQMIATLAGSSEWQEPAVTIDDTAAPGIGNPSLQPPAVSPEQTHAPNVTNPLDNSQSQP